MIQDHEYCPLRLENEKLIVEELPTELMIYDSARNKAFCLNQTAAFVWRHANGKTSVAEMTRLLGIELGQPVKDQVIWYALEGLSKDGLLAEAQVLPAVAAGVTRRALLQKLGVGAAVSVPLVTAMMVAPAKAHASSSTRRHGYDYDSSENYHSYGNPPKHTGGFLDWLSKLFG